MKRTIIFVSAAILTFMAGFAFATPSMDVVSDQGLSRTVAAPIKVDVVIETEGPARALTIYQNFDGGRGGYRERGVESPGDSDAGDSK